MAKQKTPNGGKRKTLKELKQERAKPGSSMSRTLRYEKARKLYLDRNSPSFMNASYSLELAGYSKSSARALAHTLWKPDGTPDIQNILPDDVKTAADEIREWFNLMTRWRKALEKVDDPIKLGSRTFAVVSAHIERLCKIFGFVLQQAEAPKTEISINFAMLPAPQQYEEAKTMVLFLMERVRALERELNIEKEKRFIFKN